MVFPFRDPHVAPPDGVKWKMGPTLLRLPSKEHLAADSCYLPGCPLDEKPRNRHAAILQGFSDRYHEEVAVALQTERLHGFLVLVGLNRQCTLCHESYGVVCELGEDVSSIGADDRDAKLFITVRQFS